MNNWILWYCDPDIAIFFNGIPNHTTLEYTPKATTDEVKDIDSKPYILNKELKIKIQYKNETTFITIPKGYRWNGANIPSFAWVLIANPDDPKVRLASMVHDFCCENHVVCRDDRYLSTKLLCSLCKSAKMNTLKVSTMFHTVDNFQKLFGKDKYGKKWGYYQKNNLL